MLGVSVSPWLLETSEREARAVGYGPWDVSTAQSQRDMPKAHSPKPEAWSPKPGVYFVAIVGFTHPFFITPCDGRKLR